MARIDEVRERYEAVTDRLFSDKEAFKEYLRYAGKFYKLPTAQTMVMFDANPNATMVADYDTWRKFGHQVQRGARSLAVLSGDGLKHYFDISQTAGEKVPYQWTMDKDTAQEYVDTLSKAEGMNFKTLSSCVNYLGQTAAMENIRKAEAALNISEEEKVAFEKSFISITQYFIAARCELGSNFKYKNAPIDLTALDMMRSKAEAEKLTEYIQIAAKSTLLSMEKSINKIIAERSMNNERGKTDILQGGREELSRNHNGERKDIQARPDEVRVLGAGGNGSDRGRSRTDESPDRPLGDGMEKVYDGELSRRNTVASGAAEMGTDTPSGGQRSVGTVGAASETVRAGKSPSDNDIHGDKVVGTDKELHSGTRGNGAGSSSAQRINNNTTGAAAEEKSPAVSVYTDKNREDERNLRDFMESYSNELEMAAATTSIDEFKEYYERRANEELHRLPSGDFMKPLLNREYLHKIAEMAAVGFYEQINDTLSKSMETPSPDLKKFYIDSDNETVVGISYSPDGAAGGQLVYNYFSYDDIFEAAEKPDPMAYLMSVSRQEHLDKDSPYFNDAFEEFMTNSEDISNRDEQYISKLIALTEPRFAIYQLRDDESLRDYHFASIAELKKNGLYIDRENYNRVYRGRLHKGETLEDLYERFNINHPSDFKGHSLSMSDIVAIRQEGQITAHYVDRIGFADVPDFNLTLEERVARVSLEANTEEKTEKRENSVVISIPFSEHPAFYDREGEYSFALANKILGILDEKQHREREDANNRVGWYHKTDFIIKAVIDGEDYNYEGRFDICDGEGDLLAHLKNAIDYFLSEDGKKLAGGDSKKYDEMRLSWEHNRDTLFPFLEKQAELSKDDIAHLEEFMATEKEWFHTPEQEQTQTKEVSEHSESSPAVTEHEQKETEQLSLFDELTQENEPDKQEEATHKYASEIKAGDTFRYRGQIATVTDDTGIYPDDIVISVIETTSSGLSYNTTQNVDKFNFAREAEYIFPVSQEQGRVLAPASPEQEKQEATVVEDDQFSDIDVAELRDYFTNPDRAEERQRNEEALVSQAEAAIKDFEQHSEKTTVSGSSDEVKLKSTVIDLANGVVYDTDYEPPKDRQQLIEGVPDYKVGDHIEVDYGKSHYSGTISYIGEIDVTIKPDVGYSWDFQTINKQLFDEQLRKDIRNAPLFIASQEKHDFTITDFHLGEGGAKAKFNANIAAIKLLKELEKENRLATPEEQETLSKYIGWGGLKQAFEENNAEWSKEYKELKELLTPEEYTAAQSTVLNAHYTSPTVINAIYKGLETLGFKGGNILEPSMGVGNFFGVMSEEMRKSSRLHGVEIDSITGRIAKQLYQTADIQVAGYENTAFSDNYFDAAIGNVPFGSYGVFDKRYNKENFFIHDYFFAKTLDKVAPNGIIAFVTTKGTLDKQNPKVREYLARRADLIGAIRLPNNAFKANAGTEVTTDIIFLQKREKMAVELPDWCYVGRNSDGVPLNNYFLEHPEMILGTMKQGIEFSMYGNAQETSCVPIEGADLSEQLEKAVTNLKLSHALEIRTHQAEKQAGIISATPDVRNFTFAEINGKMYYRENNTMTLVTETGKKAERIRELNELRKTFREILSAQEHNCSDEELKALQAKLNEQYDRFVKKNGYITDSANAQAFSRDDDYNSLCALEVIDEEEKTVKKSDFFTKRTVKLTVEITRVDTPQEAMQVSIDTIGKMDIPYMARLCEQEPQTVIDALKADNLIFLNPLKANPDNPFEGWEEASEYLSGNVREKLRTAELFAKDNPEYERNVAGLTSILPPKLEAGDISVRIGVSWVDVEDYQKFLEEYAKSHFFTPMRRTITGEYKIENKSWDTSAAATQIYGTMRMNAKTIFENLLNSRDIVVRDKITDDDGKEHYELNKKETELAQDRAFKMKEAFKTWLWADPARREKYVERYNNLFNCIVGRKFDGSHQTFPDMSPSIQLKPHQLDAVMRAKFGGNTLLAHCVGAGKSFEMVAATMEKKRLGLINKACVVVPKHLVAQMASEWLRLYPQAKILTASEKDFDKDHRQRFIGRCCTGDYDAVIMSYEQFEKIPMSMEYRRNFIQREIDLMQSGIDELKGDSANRSSIKDLEREKKRLEVRLKKLIDGSKKTKDTSLTFEQLGFDSLVVDEAHNYKNGLVVSKMNRVSGVQTRPAQKSEDILMKTQYLNETYGEKNIIFASGTPVSNSMTELYVMQRYLRPSLLAQAGLQTFDDWAANFGEVVSKAELKPAGNGYRTKKRFAKFNNIPELMQMYKEFADVRTQDMLQLPVPDIEGGKPQTIVATPNDVQKAYMQELAARSEAIHRGTVDPSVDNMLKITGEARLLGLDARCIMPTAENCPDSKVNLCIDKVMEIYNKTSDTKGVQAIFCDIAVSSEGGRFSVYDYIKEELIKRGIPESEICTAGDAETQKQRNEMYAQLRSGTKRIVLASTSKK